MTSIGAIPRSIIREHNVLIGLFRVPGPKGQRVRYLDVYFGKLWCYYEPFGILVQKVDGSDTKITSTKLKMLIGLTLAPGAKGRRFRCIDDFYVNLKCQSVSFRFLVQKVDWLDT